jgi:hypothetical protein
MLYAWEKHLTKWKVTFESSKRQIWEKITTNGSCFLDIVYYTKFI